MFTPTGSFRDNLLNYIILFGFSATMTGAGQSQCVAAPQHVASGDSAAASVAAARKSFEIGAALLLHLALAFGTR
jgi:hypothetical protein